MKVNISRWLSGVSMKVSDYEGTPTFVIEGSHYHE